MGNAVEERAPSVTSSSLLAQVTQADTQAWSRLVKLYGPLVYGWSRHSGLQADDAHDTVQEVFKSVYIGIAAFRHDRPRDSFRSWLKTIARNKIRDLWRRRQRHPVGIGGSGAQRFFARLPEAEEPELPDDPDDLEQIYCQALELVQADCEATTWEAFRQVTLEGRSPSDVAVSLGISRNAVYIAKSRVLSSLRVLFAELLDSAEASLGDESIP